MTRINVYQQTPLPIETAYFLNDAVKVNTEGGKKLMRDPNKFNRFYFNYPPEWKTSNTGEMIVGVRSMWTLHKKREVSFLLYLRKYRKQKFYETAKTVYPDEYGNLTFVEFLETYIDDDKIQTIINQMDLNDIIVAAFPITVLFETNESFSDFHKNIETCLSYLTSLKNFLKYLITMSDDISSSIKLSMYQTFDKYTDEELACKYQWGFWFDQLNNKDNYFSNSKDMLMTGLYYDKTFFERIYSPRNVNHLDPFYVDIMFAKNGKTYYKRYQKMIANEIPPNDSTEYLPPLKVIYNPRSRLDPIPIDESDKFDDDFNTVFNIGDQPHQNSLEYITKFHRNIILQNVYDRSTVKVHASFANQSNDYYVGNSHVYFNPIKYYKLNSKDDKFWIDFYSGRYHDCPVNIPDDEGFVLEMLFMQNQKLLYV